MNALPKYNYILASASPRRKQLLADAGLEFTVKSFETDESYPDGLTMTEIPIYLAVKKAEPFLNTIRKNDLVIAADTIVWLDGSVLGKPGDDKEAIEMLRALSGKWHQVVTGVCLLTGNKQTTFSSLTNVEFKPLSLSDIEFYVKNFKPFDKAGAYGIQEWIGLIGIKRINGSYHNVVGLPVQELIDAIRAF